MKKKNKKKKWEYMIAPVSFPDGDYDRAVDILNEYGEQGWTIGDRVDVHSDSPTIGHTTWVFVCRRIKKGH